MPSGLQYTCFYFYKWSD